MSQSTKSRFRVAVDVTLVLAVAMSAVIFFIPTDAKASCFYPKRTVKQYIGYVYDSGNGGNTPHCTAPVIGPPGVYQSSVVGEEVTECDGSVSSWGIVCDTVQITRTQCEPICD